MAKAVAYSSFCDLVSLSIFILTSNTGNFKSVIDSLGLWSERLEDEGEEQGDFSNPR
jgi:hypothetical protein